MQGHLRAVGGGVGLRYTSRHDVNGKTNVTYIVKCNGERATSTASVVDVTNSPIAVAEPSSQWCCFAVKFIADPPQPGATKEQLINFRLKCRDDGTAETGNVYHHDHDRRQTKSDLIAEAAIAAGVSTASVITDEMVDEV